MKFYELSSELIENLKKCFLILHAWYWCLYQVLAPHDASRKGLDFPYLSGSSSYSRPWNKKKLMILVTLVFMIGSGLNGFFCSWNRDTLIKSRNSILDWCYVTYRDKQRGSYFTYQICLTFIKCFNAKIVVSDRSQTWDSLSWHPHTHISTWSEQDISLRNGNSIELR